VPSDVPTDAFAVSVEGAAVPERSPSSFRSSGAGTTARITSREPVSRAPVSRANSS
jgi:hypothetical protein